MTAEALAAWCAKTAAGLRTHQRTNRYTSVDPEQEAVQYVLKALAEGGCPATAAVLENIDRQRAGMVAS